MAILKDGYGLPVACAQTVLEVTAKGNGPLSIPENAYVRLERADSQSERERLQEEYNELYGLWQALARDRASALCQKRFDSPRDLITLNENSSRLIEKATAFAPGDESGAFVDRILKAVLKEIVAWHEERRFEARAETLALFSALPSFEQLGTVEEPAWTPTLTRSFALPAGAIGIPEACPAS